MLHSVFDWRQLLRECENARMPIVFIKWRCYDSLCLPGDAVSNLEHGMQFLQYDIYFHLLLSVITTPFKRAQT